jgi:hypothetical protein
MKALLSVSMLICSTALACAGSDDSGSTNEDTGKPAPNMTQQSETSMDTSNEEPADEANTNTGGDVTSAAPALCETDTDCPQGIACITFEGSEVGFCDVQEAVNDDAESGANDPNSGGAPISNAAPAPCASDADCPTGIACVSFDPGGPGHCDVGELAVTPDAGR